MPPELNAGHPMPGNNRNTAADFDLLAHEYDFMDSIFNDNNYFLSLMPPDRLRALDVGCGSGILALALSPHFNNVVGIDNSAEMLAIAESKRQAPNIKYLRIDAAQFSDQDKFDFIVSRNTFHHIPDLPSLIEKLKTMLNPGGRIVILDCVLRVRKPSSAHTRAFAYLEFPRNLIRLGPKAAARIFRFRTSREWIRHLAADEFLSEPRFHEIFDPILPGCSIEKVRCFLGVAWGGIAVYPPD